MYYRWFTRPCEYYRGNADFPCVCSRVFVNAFVGLGGFGVVQVTRETGVASNAEMIWRISVWNGTENIRESVFDLFIP